MGARSPRATSSSFAGISGDFFYAHTDDVAAKDSIFERRVAHGYFVLSAAAGLFVDPAPGPVLANYGLESLRFVKPVYIGDTIRVRLTCKQKTAKEDREGQIPQGVVAWDVEVTNQRDEPVAVYTILTLVRRLAGAGAPETRPELERALRTEAPDVADSGDGHAANAAGGRARARGLRRAGVRPARPHTGAAHAGLVVGQAGRFPQSVAVGPDGPEIRTPAAGPSTRIRGMRDVRT